MPTLSARVVAEPLKALLPPDGTPVLNRVLRAMLSRDFGQPVDGQLYEQARDQLFAAGQIGRLLRPSISLKERKRSPSGCRIERNRLRFFRKPADSSSRARPEGAAPQGAGHSGPRQWLVKDTSRFGPPLGRWALASPTQSGECRCPRYSRYL
jgi:hypothetical protein